MAQKTKKQIEASKRLDAKLKKEMGAAEYKRAKEIGSKHFDSWEEIIQAIIDFSKEKFPEDNKDKKKAA